ncbi:alpha/beta fold hydrolase [Halococcus sediminicola]|uniref:alpha/beta fold hydrolase n=1 Tax=Halococcus sediminicola TaxID=1264579 RepID=UPI000679A8FA|nr:alpha/beta hydrolase [Halococcus sediminicola]
MTTLTLDGAQFWYEETGTGPPLVFLHGGWMNADTWQTQVERFAEEHRVITFDLRGHGRTGATDRRQYTIELFADDLERLLDQLDVERPILCGLSLGGMVVQEYLDRHPNRAVGAVIGGPLQSMPPVDLPPGIKPFISPLPGLAASLSVIGPRASFQWLLGGIRIINGGPWLSVDPVVKSQAMDAVGDISNEEFRKIFSALYKYDPPELSHVATPTLVIYGERETAPVQRQGERLAATVNDGDWTMIPDAGHLVNQDNSEAFDGVCAKFFEEITASV